MMYEFMKVLKEAGIEESILKHVMQNQTVTGGDIANLIEYEISKNEDLEDIFLQEAHSDAMHKVVTTYLKKIIDKTER